MRKNQLLVLVALLATGMIASACGSGAGGDDEPADDSRVIQITPEMMEFGAETYKTNCVPCHGPGGKGDGPSAASLTPPPRDHTNAEYMSRLNDKQIADTIKMGGIISGYPNMPSNPRLRGAEIESLVAFVRRLSSPDATEIDLTGFLSQ